ncbi:MAG: radical SAM protein [Candidatus Aminicenantes bacterium]|nr:MAG: radical SAM protein [Candidatus Aminicenantes bacterium]
MPKENFIPAYRKAHEQGLFPDIVQKAHNMLESCTVCPRDCGVDRTQDEKGFCEAGYLPEVSSYAPHFGEESPLVGHHGSGTIFLTHCNLGCLFCQNYSISHAGEGQKIPIHKLANVMVELQRLGCHNINFVSPTHFVPQILESLPQAIEMGLDVPLVYNTGGYDSVETLRLLDGIFDIYMPDFKYSKGEVSKKYSQASDYPLIAKSAIKEMFRQVGDLQIDEQGVAVRGLLVRHLVLPSDLAGTREVMRFFASEISQNTYVNIMDQYYPCGNIPLDSPLNRRITAEEYNQAIAIAKEEGITRLDKREKLRLVWF